MGCVQGRGLGARVPLGFDFGHIGLRVGRGVISGSCGSCGGLLGCVRGRRLGGRPLWFGRFCSPGGVIGGSCGGYGSFLACGWLFSGCGKRGGCGLCPKSRAWCAAPRLPRFILLGSFSDILLVVSILDMIAVCSHFCSPEGVNWSLTERKKERLFF